MSVAAPSLVPTPPSAPMAPVQPQPTAGAGAVSGSKRMAQGWDRSEFETLIDRAADPLGPDWSPGAPSIRTYSYWCKQSRTTRLASAMTVDVTNTKTGENHTVVISRTLDGPGSPVRYRFWCGDRFLDGSLQAGLRTARIDEAVRSANLPLTAQAQVRNDLLAARGSSKTNAACSFSSSFELNPEEAGCEHVRGVFHILKSEAPNGAAIRGVLNAIDKRHEELSKLSWDTLRRAPSSPISVNANVQAVAPTVISASADQDKRLLELEQKLRADPLIAEVLNYSGPRVESKMPVILLGEAGWGKSETLRSIDRAGLYDKVIEFPIVNGMDGTDFIGGPVALSRTDADGQLQRVFFHRDSPFIEACRLAESGKRVAILFEELPRASRSMLSALPALLNPNGNVLEIHTGRAVGVTADGVANTEKLRVPRKNLSIWATGNAGGDYDCQGFQEGGDRAVINRFHRIYVRPDPQKLMSIADQLATGHGWSPDGVAGLKRFLLAMEKNWANKMTKAQVNIRDVAWVVNCIGKQVDQAVPMLKQAANRWTGIDLDGYPIQEQVDAVHDAIDLAFKVKPTV